ncbi:MAG: hypothetical protein AAGC43_14985 [Bacteroidota bacterium]
MKILRILFLSALVTCIGCSSSETENPDITNMEGQNEMEMDDSGESDDAEDSDDTEGSRVFGAGIRVTNQAQIDSIGFFGYTRLQGGLIIDGRDNENPIRDLTPFRTLTQLDAGLNIVDTRYLKSLDGLENLNLIGGIQVIGNDSLESIDALRGLTQINTIRRRVTLTPFNFFRNPRLESLSGFRNVTFIDTVSVSIGANSSLTSLNGLENLVTCFGISVNSNENLRSLSGLENVERIEADFTVSNNSLLESLDVGKLETLGRFLTIQDNPEITSLEGLNSISRLESDLDVQNHAIIRNERLNDFCGIQEALKNSDTTNLMIRIFSNAANPTVEQIVNDNCN